MYALRKPYQIPKFLKQSVVGKYKGSENNGKGDAKTAEWYIESELIITYSINNNL